jgi:hypothetical protein
VFAAVIPGRMDTPVEEFLRLGMHAEEANDLFDALNKAGTIS